MFAYIDEAGHTGKNNSDITQPVFYYLCILTNQNIDITLKDDISFIKAKYGITELHGSELSDKIEYISKDILQILQKISPHFSISIVDKEYLSYTKLFDTLFDNVENKGARPHTYQFRPFRIMLLNNLCYITPIEVAYNFYQNCLFGSKEEDAITVLIETCDAILSRTFLLKDERSKELISDALIWAKNNPKEITAFNTRKIDRWRHLPHVVSFLPLMDMISRYSKKEKSPIRKIVHDEQQQIKKVISEIHALASDKKLPAILNLRENGSYDLTNIKESIFEIKDSKNSIGLQIVDFCLYLLTHSEYVAENRNDLMNSYALLDFIMPRGEVFDFTMESFKSESATMYKKIMEHEYSEEELQKGKDMIKIIEDNYRKQKGDT